MCLAIPAKIVSIDGYMASCDTEGVCSDIGVHLVPGLKVGDWVLVHAGYAIQVINEQAARETLEMLQQLTGDQ